MENIKKNKPFIISVVVGATLIIALLVYSMSSKSKDKPKGNAETTINITETDSKENKNEDGEGDYEEGDYFQGFCVIANSASLRSAPNNNKANEISELKFGAKVYSKDYEDNEFRKVYLVEPKNKENPTETSYYIRNNAVVESYEFKEYKKYFSIMPFKDLHSDIKHLILQNDYSEQRTYEISQNEARIKKALCYGDFDKDGLGDLAVVLDENEDQYSRVLIICHNKATQKPYVAFAQNFYGIMRVNSFNSGAKIINNYGALVTSKVDGVILQGENEKYAIVYDFENFKFNLINQNEAYDAAEDASADE